MNLSPRWRYRGRGRPLAHAPRHRPQPRVLEVGGRGGSALGGFLCHGRTSSMGWGGEEEVRRRGRGREEEARRRGRGGEEEARRRGDLGALLALHSRPLPAKALAGNRAVKGDGEVRDSGEERGQGDVSDERLGTDNVKEVNSIDECNGSIESNSSDQHSRSSVKAAISHHHAASGGVPHGELSMPSPLPGYRRVCEAWGGHSDQQVFGLHPKVAASTPWGRPHSPRPRREGSYEDSFSDQDIF